MGRQIIRYRWRYFCDIRKRFITTKAHFEEEMIKAEHPDATPVEGTRIESVAPDNPFTNSTSSFLAGVEYHKLHSSD